MHTAIVLDINSGSVGGGVVLLRKRLPPALLYSFRKNFRVPEDEKVELIANSPMPDREQVIQSSHLRHSMRRVLDQVLRQVYNDGLVTLAKNDKIPRKVDNILVTLSSLWGERDLEVVEDEITKVLGSKRGICVKDFIFVLSHTLGLAEQEDVLIVSVSGEVTELIPANDISKIRSESVLVGPETVARAISIELNIEPHLATSLVSLYSQNALNPDKKDEIESIIIRETGKWREAVSHPAIAQKIKKIHLFSSRSYAGLAGRVLKGAYPGAEIIFEERDPLEILSAFSNSLL